jgi:putative aldouronate transport system permease protein
MERTVIQIKPIKRKSLLRKVIDYRYLYLMLLPAILFYIIFKYVPMYGVVMAFKDFSYSKGIMGSPWVGFKYFQEFFDSYLFSRLMTNTVLISLYKIFWGFPIPIIIALMLNEVYHTKYKKFIQTTIYLPNFISWVVVSMLVFTLFSAKSGAVSKVIFSITGEEFKILTSPESYRGFLVFVDIWKNAGWGSIIFLAALSSVDVQLYEAAVLDGAKRFQQLWHITLPGIMNVIVIMFILRCGSIMDAGFEQILLMQNDFVIEKVMIIDTYAYQVGLIQGDYSYGAMIGLFKSAISLVLILSVNKAASKIGEAGLW